MHCDLVLQLFKACVVCTVARWAKRSQRLPLQGCWLLLVKWADMARSEIDHISFAGDVPGDGALGNTAALTMPPGALFALPGRAVLTQAQPGRISGREAFHTFSDHGIISLSNLCALASASVPRLSALVGTYETTSN